MQIEAANTTKGAQVCRVSGSNSSRVDIHNVGSTYTMLGQHSEHSVMLFNRFDSVFLNPDGDVGLFSIVSVQSSFY